MIKAPHETRGELAEELAHKLDLRFYDGYNGLFTRNNAPGALPAGTRIIKTNSDNDEDSHVNGSLGTVLGSLAAPGGAPVPTPLGLVEFFYFVEWDDAPKLAVGCVSVKLEKLEGGLQ